MHSARALFLTFLAPEKSKRNTKPYENSTSSVRSERSEKDHQRSRGGRSTRSLAELSIQNKFFPIRAQKVT